MDLLGILRNFGDRLGILEISGHQPPSAPVKIRTRSVTLTELATTVQVGELQALADLPAELSVPFDEIYKVAGIEPTPTGWNVEKLRQFLKSEPLRKMDRAAAQQETLRVLSAEKVDATELIKDAVSRDQALDAFQESITRKRKDRKAARERKLAELQAQRKKLELEMATDEEKWQDWRQRKRQVERDMAHAIGYLIDKPVISIDEENSGSGP